jgi:two-component system chemotaxis response regulator CheB
MVKILVVDDSSVMRHMVKNVLNEIDGFQVIDVAPNGLEGKNKVLKLNPDVVIMDLNMGEYDGVYGVREIMKYQPTPIILLSSVGNSNMSQVFEALDAGAVDYINKPIDHQSNIREVKENLESKIRSAYRSNLEYLKNKRSKKANSHAHTFHDELNYDLILIGASTGGPTAVNQVLSNLPQNLPVPVIIGQHMPENFVPSFVDRLQLVTQMKVSVATDGMEVQDGTIYVLAGGKNTRLVKTQKRVVFRETEEQFEAYNNPSIDSLFLSASKIFGGRIVCAILTGMGRDGAEGIKKIKDSGGLTIAQNEKSCVVFGMPKRAHDIGGVEYMLDLSAIAPFITSGLA